MTSLVSENKKNQFGHFIFQFVYSKMYPPNIYLDLFTYQILENKLKNI